MKKILILGIIVLFGAVLVLTCPDKQKHVDAISSVFDYVAQRAAEEPGGTFSDQYLGAMLLSQISSLAIPSLLEVDNYFVVSIGHISLPNEEPEVVSVGLLGHVFTLNKDDVYDALMAA